MRNAWTVPTTSSTEHKRTAERRSVAVPARLTWKDQRGTTRFASVVTRNVSEFGVYVECHSPVSIPLYRLVQFQLERDVREADGLPQSLRQGRALVGGLPREPAEAVGRASGSGAAADGGPEAARHRRTASRGGTSAATRVDVALRACDCD